MVFQGGEQFASGGFVHVDALMAVIGVGDVVGGAGVRKL